MTDDNPDDPMVRRCAQVAIEGAVLSGAPEAWQGAVAALTKKVQAGEITQDDLARKLAKPNAAADIFFNNIADTDEATWRKWRDAQPRRAERIARTK